jgi:autotransporter translocation and assembly factor TamB
MRKWTVRTILAGFAGISLILGVAFLLIATDRGTRWLLETVVTYSGQEIELDQISGNLLSPITIERVSYNACNTRVDIENLQMHWHLEHLLQSTLDIQELLADRILIQAQADCAESTQEKAGLPDRILLPVAVNLDKFEVNRIVVQGPGRNETGQQEFRRLSLRANARDNFLDLELKNLDFTTFNLKSRLTSELGQPYKLEGNAQWRYLLDDDQLFEGAISLTGNIEELQLTHHLQQPYAIDTDIRVKNPTADLQFESDSRWEVLEIPSPDDQKISIRQGQVQIGGSVEEVTYAIDGIVDSMQAMNVVVSGKGSATRESVTIESLIVGYQGTTVSTRGKVEIGEKIEASLDVVGDSINPELVLAGFPGELDLESHLEFVHHQDRNWLQVQIRKLEGRLLDYSLAGSGQVQSDLEKINLEDINIAVSENQITINGSVDETIDLRTSFQLPSPELFLGDLTGDLQGAIHVTGQTSNPRINAEVSSSQLHFRDVVKLRNGEVTVQLDGIEENSPYRLDMVVDTEKADRVSVSARGMFSGKNVTLEPLLLSHEATQLNARGELGFGSGISTSLTVRGDGLDPALLFPDYPGNLRLDAQVEYSQQPDNNLLQLEVSQLAGELRNYAIKGSGYVNSDLDSFNLDRIRLAIGDNAIEINGVVGEDIDIQGSVQAPQIEQVYGEAQGDLQGTVLMLGQFPKLQLDVDISSSALQFRDLFNLRNAVLSAHLSGETNQALDMDVDIQQIAVKDQSLESIILQVKGTQQNHNIDSSVVTEFGAITISASGEYLDETSEWRGEVDKITLASTPLGDWVSTEMAQVTASASKQLVDGLCLGQDNQSVCVDYHNDSQNFQSIRARIEAFNLESVQSFVREQILVSGFVQSDVDIVADEQGVWTGEVSVETDQVRLAPTQDSGIDETLEFEKLDADLQLDSISRLQVEFDSNRGAGDADIEIRSLQNINAAEIMQGAIKVSIPELVFLNAYIDVLEIREGQVNIDMDISGKLKKPLLKGVGEIESFRFYVPQLGTEFDDSSFSIIADDFAHLQVKGHMASGAGELTLRGKPPAVWPYRVLWLYLVCS